MYWATGLIQRTFDREASPPSPQNHPPKQAEKRKYRCQNIPMHHKHTNPTPNTNARKRAARPEGNQSKDGIRHRLLVKRVWRHRRAAQTEEMKAATYLTRQAGSPRLSLSVRASSVEGQPSRTLYAPSELGLPAGALRSVLVGSNFGGVPFFFSFFGSISFVASIMYCPHRA